MGIMSKKAGLLGLMGLMIGAMSSSPSMGGSATRASVADLRRLGKRRDENIRAMYGERCIRN